MGKLLGLNFADDRIKGYDLQMPGDGRGKTFFVLCVRGTQRYGTNDFQDNGDGTITDHATGLMWSRTDSGQGLNWKNSLAWVQKRNADAFFGHDHWRLPSVKDLQSIVDCTRSPDTSHSPAIDPIFDCTTITNEARQADYPFYWSSTTHAGSRGGGAATYVAFGRTAGWMTSCAIADGPPERRGGPGLGARPGREREVGDYSSVTSSLASFASGRLTDRSSALNPGHGLPFSFTPVTLTRPSSTIET